MLFFLELTKRVFPAESSRLNPKNSPQKRKMILTTCAACAAPLAHDAPRCIRCMARATLGGDSSSKEKRKALQTLEETLGVMRRVLGPQHPETQRVQGEVEVYREAFPTTA